MAERDDNRAAIRDFLSSRRAKISPEQAGLPAGGGTRRVPGLRREEVAVLAGVSTDWYIRLEKGHIAGVSEDVLDAVARALQLDEAEREHLFNLARAARPMRTPRRRSQPQLRPSLTRILDSMTGVAAFIRNARLDVLAINPLGKALYAPVFELADADRRVPNIARFNFLDPRARAFYPEWDESADTTVALLRTAAGRDPDDRDLTDLVGELATRSDEFRTRWGAHNVRLHRGGLKHFHHPIVGELALDYDSMDMPAAPGLALTIYSAAPDTASADALTLLAAWNAPTTLTPVDHTSDDTSASEHRHP